MKNEYLITNGLGGYTSSDVLAGNTRKYHGTLVAAMPKMERRVVVNRIDELVRIGGETIQLSKNHYGEAHQINADPGYVHHYKIGTPTEIVYRIPDCEITKTISVVKGRNQVTLDYTIHTEFDTEFELTPLLSDRVIHELQHAKEVKFPKTLQKQNVVEINFNSGITLIAESDGLDFFNGDDFYYNFDYPIEAFRGYDSCEDLIKVGSWKTKLTRGDHKLRLKFEVVTELQPENVKPVKSERNDLLSRLEEQAEHFVVIVDGRPGIIAGYHWFSEWGRDTFMSANGLLLQRQKYREAENLIRRWAAYLKNGLLPNLPHEMDYRSIDAILWFGIFIWNYYQHTQDIVLPAEIISQLEATIVSFVKGTNGTKVDEYGLLYDTNSEDALTWMDAKVDGKPVINRSGRAVEIQSLWFNFLKIVYVFKQELNRHEGISMLAELINKTKVSFNQLFWNSERGYLIDVNHEKYNDYSLRPNQLFVLYLPFPIVKINVAKKILTNIEKELLTPVGLRTLSPKDSAYKGIYSGEQKKRDLAYHNGTVWPFLLGMYLVSYLKVHRYTLDAQNYVKHKLNEFEIKIHEQGLNYIPEVFSADDMTTDGCLSQAWSVSFMLEAYMAIYPERKNKLAV